MRIVKAIGLFALLHCQSAWSEDWIDLTHDLSEDAVFWPTADPFELKTEFEGVTEGGYYYSAYSFTTAEHGGTHIDAPVHFSEGRRPVNEIPLDQLIGTIASLLRISPPGNNSMGRCRAAV